MKWISNMNRQVVLPILFGISLTTFGLSVAILLYSMLEKDDGDNRKKRGQIATSKRKDVTMQIKIPEKYVSAIIGKGGTVIKNIEELTNTRIKMEKENFSSERVCYIQSDNVENIYSAQNMIQSIINNLPVIETFELFVPFEASRKVFKRNSKSSNFAQEIQKSYGAKVIVENNAHKTATGLKRRIILKGTADQIVPAIIRIEDKVQEEVEDCSQLQFASARIFRHLKNTDTKNDYPNNEIYDYLLPYEACKKSIEKDENTIQEIEKSSGAKIIIDDETIAKYEDKEKKVIIRGTANQVSLAMNLIEIGVQEAYESQIKSDSCDVAIKKISESSLCDNDSSMSNVLNSVLEQDGLMEVYVSAVKTPSLFWIQVNGPANIDLQHLVNEMTEYYNNKENRGLHILKKITVGQMVAAKFKYDGKWYRAEVISIIDSTLCQIFFVDYGDLEIISKDDIFELCTNMLSLRQQAVECSLANVKPQEDTWNVETIDKFAELVYLATWEPLVAKVKGYKERPVCDGESRRQSSLIPCIDLYDKDSNKNVGNELIQLGMAQVEEQDSSTGNSALSYDKYNSPSIPCLPDPLYLN